MTRKPKSKTATEATRPASEARGELSIVLDGAPMVLRPSHEAIEAFELATGRGLIELAQGCMAGKLRLSEVAQIVTECVRAWGRATNTSYKNVQPDRIAELILESEGGLARVLTTITGLLAMASTGGYTAQGEVKAGTATTTNAAPAED